MCPRSAPCSCALFRTHCRNHLFSLSLNPPPDVSVAVEAFEDAIARIEAKLGLSGQPRAIVFHEKNGRRHAHCVWSRIDAGTMKAINLPHSRRKLMDVAQELYREHGWEMPAGFVDPEKRDPLTFDRAEAGQAKRAARDPSTLKEMFALCWERSDSRAGFAAALWAEGYCLAQGDRRGFVAVDREGKPWSLSRWCGAKPKDLLARLGDPEDLPSVEEAQLLMEAAPASDRSRGAIKPDADFDARRRRLVQTQRRERDALLVEQERRLTAEQRARTARVPRGLKAVWARVSGTYAGLLAKLADEATKAELRDRYERQLLIDRHLAERKALERSRAADDLARDLEATFATAARRDPRQTLVLPPESLPFTRGQLVRDPSLILGYLSHKHAQFTEIEVKRALAQHIDEPLTVRSAIDTALAAPDVVRLDDGSLTTQEYQDAIAQLESDSAAMRGRGGFAVASGSVARAMAAQNARLRDRVGGTLSEEQQEAIRHVLGYEQFACVVGLAGSGKSTMLATARDAWARQGVRVHGAALAGKAAEGLQSASGIESRTLASLETSWRNGYEPISKGDVLVVDEAGMIGTRQLMRIARKLRELGAKLVLVGDPGQLQPIEAGTPFRRMVELHGAASLSEIHRQKQAWQRQASRDLAEGRLAKAYAAYDQDGSVRRNADRDGALAALVEDYLADAETHGPGTSQLAFAHRRRDVFALNQAIRAALRRSREAQSEMIFETETGTRAFAPGDRIVFTRNDRNFGVKNGMLGTVDAIDVDELRIRLDGDPLGHHVIIDPHRYKSFDHGYAVTIHKSQGATVDHAYVLASRLMDAPLTYVALTRHRRALRLYLTRDDAPEWAEERHGSDTGRYANSRKRPRDFAFD